jgi:hypothetical protein
VHEFERGQRRQDLVEWFAGRRHAPPPPVRKRGPEPFATAQHEIPCRASESTERGIDRVEQADLRGEEVRQGPLDRIDQGVSGLGLTGYTPVPVSLERVVPHELYRTLA